jgi:hypothetical protein
MVGISEYKLQRPIASKPANAEVEPVLGSCVDADIGIAL